MDDVIIVGGGAAGMFAAIMAANEGLKVTIFEKNKMLGKKLRITGKGRCNVTNNCDTQDFINHLTKNSKFMFSAHQKFNSKNTYQFFESLGVPLKIERGNRVFPKSNKAIEVVDALISTIKKLNVKVVFKPVDKIIVKYGKAVKVKSGNREYLAENIIIATGGLSYPLTGSTGDGYKFASELGHKVIKQVPSLCAIITKEKWVKEIEGLSLKNVDVALYSDKEQIFKERGEMVFTSNGVSGPLILKASALLRDLENKKNTIIIDLKPAIDYNILDKRLLNEFFKYPNKEIKTILKEVLPKSIIDVVLNLSRVDKNMHIYDLKRELRKNLIITIKNMMLNVKSLASIEEAITTSGGISVKELDARSFESKIIKNLFFIGEVIDVDGLTGGYNLQICWSSGYSAVSHIKAKKQMEEKSGNKSSN